MSKYEVLVNILDKIRLEAAVTKYRPTYLPASHEVEAINYSRSRAFIHLLIKVYFGLLNFDERERFITDGAYDGGIDGYFLDKEHKLIYFVQSKFRVHEKNFEQKKIEISEILAMDINRVLDGHATDENGNEYNGKIKQMVREIRSIEDIGRYKYKVIILANERGTTEEKLKSVVGGHPVEVFNFERCYSELVFPVVSGTYFCGSDLNILIDLSNKNAGSKISYEVGTQYAQCEITVLFVPTIEMARVLLKYKNSILRYNPRSYLEFEGQKVNNAIRDTILKIDTNEFALFNNGVTMLSDETYINERIGQKNKAQLSVKNPQIINGGQTAYTLGQILLENAPEKAEEIFQGKEVLLKVITFTNDGKIPTAEHKLKLIEEISTATNQQTAVINADRISNDEVHLSIQSLLFSRYGLLYERKRGEFHDGISSGYITADDVVERNLFLRIYCAIKGDIKKATEKRIFLNFKEFDEILSDLDSLDHFYFGLFCYRSLVRNRGAALKRDRELFAKVCVMSHAFMPTELKASAITAEDSLEEFKIIWAQFLSYKESTNADEGLIRNFLDQETKQYRKGFSRTQWFKSGKFERDVKEYFAEKLHHVEKQNGLPKR